MKKFKYTAINLNKKKFTGVFLAEDERSLAQSLAEQNLYLIKASPIKRMSVNSFFSLSGKISAREMAMFCRQFSIMITTGIPIVDSLRVLKGQAYSMLLRHALEFIYEDVKGGVLLSQAVEKHKRIFPYFFCSMIRVGECSGALDKIMVTLADYFETDARIKNKTINAMIYPVLLIVMAIGVFILMVSFVIPAFIEALATIDVEMPKLTLSLYRFSIVLRENWQIIALSVAGFFLAIIGLRQTARGRYFFDFLTVKLPILGGISRSLLTARFARSFGLLIDGGIDVVEALETVEIVLGNKFIEKRFHAAIEEVRQGMSLTVALQSYRLFPSMMLQMIAVGERTGSLADVLMRSSPFFDQQAETALTSISTMLQPIMLVVIGGLVGVLFYAIYSPLLQVMEGIGG